jgi:hypothetical protein
LQTPSKITIASVPRHYGTFLTDTFDKLVTTSEAIGLSISSSSPPSLSIIPLPCSAQKLSVPAEVHSFEYHVPWLDFLDLQHCSLPAAVDPTLLEPEFFSAWNCIPEPSAGGGEGYQYVVGL